jgi:hypothetical protein
MVLGFIEMDQRGKILSLALVEPQEGDEGIDRFIGDMLLLIKNLHVKAGVEACFIADISKRKKMVIILIIIVMVTQIIAVIQIF